MLKRIQNPDKYQKQPPEVFHKKGVLKYFSKFTGKHLCTFQDFFYFFNIANYALVLI